MPRDRKKKKSNDVVNPTETSLSSHKSLNKEVAETNSQSAKSNEHETENPNSNSDATVSLKQDSAKFYSILL